MWLAAELGWDGMLRNHGVLSVIDLNTTSKGVEFSNFVPPVLGDRSVYVLNWSSILLATASITIWVHIDPELSSFLVFSWLYDGPAAHAKQPRPDACGGPCDNPIPVADVYIS